MIILLMQINLQLEIDEFSWEDYGIQKAISIAITISTCGMSALKETGRAIQTGANLVKNISIKGVGKQLIGQFTKQDWQLVGKQIAIAFVKAGAQEVIKTVLDKTILSTLNEKINEEITENITGKIKHEIDDNQLTKGVSGKALKIFTAGKCLTDLTRFS